MLSRISAYASRHFSKARYAAAAVAPRAYERGNLHLRCVYEADEATLACTRTHTYTRTRAHVGRMLAVKQNTTEQNRTEQSRAEQNRTEQNGTERSRAEPNETEQKRTQ